MQNTHISGGRVGSFNRIKIRRFFPIAKNSPCNGKSATECPITNAKNNCAATVQSGQGKSSMV
jgi:hypothetical protein